MTARAGPVKHSSGIGASSVNGGGPEVPVDVLVALAVDSVFVLVFVLVLVLVQVKVRENVPVFVPVEVLVEV